jgi:hypothetical protein
VVPPTLSYGTALNFTTNTAVSPIIPTSTNVAPFGYNNTFASPDGSQWGYRTVKRDSHGNLYLLTNFTYNLTRFPTDGSDPTSFVPVLAFALDANDNIYTYDLFAKTLNKIAAGTGEVTTMTTGLDFIDYITVAKSGDIYVSGSSDNLIKKIPAGGGAPVAIGTGFNSPTGTAFDAAGDLYVGDRGNNKLKKIWLSTDGHTSDVADIGIPSAVTIDKANNIFVFSQGDRQIHELPANGSGQQVIVSDLYIQGLDVDKKGVLNIASGGYNNVLAISPTGGYFIDKMLPAGLSFDQATGIISGTPTAVSAITNYQVTAYNGIENITTNFTIKVASTDANLTALTISSGTLSPAFSADTLNYSALVSAVTASVNITPTVVKAGTTVTYNGQTYASGSAINVALSAGANTIPLLVSAAGGETKTYTITVAKGIIPGLDYGPGNKTFALDVAASPVIPTASNVAPFGYNNSIVPFGNDVGGGKDVATDSHGNVFMIDTAGLITKYAPDGSVVGTINTIDNGALAIAIDKDDNIYTTNLTGGITRIAAGTGQKTIYATGGNDWYDIAVDKNGAVYVADISDNTVKQIPVGGGTAVVVGTGFNQAASIAVDAAGDVFVGDLGNLKIKKIRMSTY